MPKVEILCLANSRKYDARCIAGLLYGGGGWVRPIGTAEMGALAAAECAYPGGKEPKVLDRICLELAEQCPLPHQPENWFTSPGTWRCLASPAPRVRLARLQRRLAVGPELFGNCGDRVDYINFRDGSAATGSLTLVLPEQLHWLIRKTSNDKLQVRAQFVLNGAQYNLAVTDPAWEERCADVIEELDTWYTTEEIGYKLKAEERLLLTMSLGQPYKDYCYKLVAAVFAIPL